MPLFISKNTVSIFNIVPAIVVKRFFLVFPCAEKI